MPPGSLDEETEGKINLGNWGALGKPTSFLPFNRIGRKCFPELQNSANYFMRYIGSVPWQNMYA